MQRGRGRGFPLRTRVPTLSYDRPVLLFRMQESDRSTCVCVRVHVRVHVRVCVRACARSRACGNHWRQVQTRTRAHAHSAHAHRGEMVLADTEDLSA